MGQEPLLLCLLCFCPILVHKLKQLSYRQSWAFCLCSIWQSMWDLFWTGYPAQMPKFCVFSQRIDCSFGLLFLHNCRGRDHLLPFGLLSFEQIVWLEERALRIFLMNILLLSAFYQPLINIIHLFFYFPASIHHRIDFPHSPPKILFYWKAKQNK